MIFRALERVYKLIHFMTQRPCATGRVFLFLQGPHGPFFAQLAAQLRQAGAATLRTGFNAGDSMFWRDRAGYIPYRGTPGDWAGTCDALLHDHAVTDLVLYGDTRAIHATAIARARKAGVRIHIFEEGYLRPYWVTYEHDGSNGNSRLIQLSLGQIASLTRAGIPDRPVPPGHWGNMRQHVFYGALYHWFVLFWNHNYPHFKPHRSLPVAREFRLYLRRLLFMPFQALERMLATFRIRRGTFAYHLALLQLEHDSSFQAHGPFDSQIDFLVCVIAGFADGAPAHHHLVFKAHPLEDGRAPIRREIRRLAKAYGIADRVHYVRGGKLAGLLNAARSAVTVNSTAGQQALWRGIPLKAFGAAVYAKPELVSDQPLAAFFANPKGPDRQAYRRFRQFLLSTSQLPGSYYASKGRRHLLRQVVDKMLRGNDPYSLPRPETATDRQQLRLVL